VDAADTADGGGRLRALLRGEGPLDEARLEDEAEAGRAGARGASFLTEKVDVEGTSSLRMEDGVAGVNDAA